MRVFFVLFAMLLLFSFFGYLYLRSVCPDRRFTLNSCFQTVAVCAVAAALLTGGLALSQLAVSAVSDPPAPAASPAPGPEASPQITELPVTDYAELLRSSAEYDGQEVRVSGRIVRLGGNTYRGKMYFSDRLGFLETGRCFEVELSRGFPWGEDIGDYYELNQYVLVQGVWYDGTYRSLRDAQVVATGEEARQADCAFTDAWVRERQADAGLPLIDHMDLTRFPERYLGQRVRTVGQIQDVTTSAAAEDTRFCFRNRDDGSASTSFSLRGCPPEMQGLCADGEYVELSCLVAEGDWGRLWFSECFIERVGDEAKALSEQADADWWARFAAEREDYISACQPYTYDELARYPNAYCGKQAALSGTVLQMSLGLRTDTVYLDMGQGCVVCIKYSGKLLNDPEILKGDQIAFYGECDGTALYEPPLGESEWVPLLNARYSSFNQFDAP